MVEGGSECWSELVSEDGLKVGVSDRYVVD